MLRAQNISADAGRTEASPFKRRLGGLSGQPEGANEGLRDARSSHRSSPKNWLLGHPGTGLRSASSGPRMALVLCHSGVSPEVFELGLAAGHSGDGPPRMGARSIGSGRERSSPSRLPSVPGFRLVTPFSLRFSGLPSRFSWCAKSGAFRVWLGPAREPPSNFQVMCPGPWHSALPRAPVNALVPPQAVG